MTVVHNGIWSEVPEGGREGGREGGSSPRP